MCSGLSSPRQTTKRGSPAPITKYERHHLWISFSWDQNLLTWAMLRALDTGQSAFTFIKEHFIKWMPCLLWDWNTLLPSYLFDIPKIQQISESLCDTYLAYTQQHGSRARMSSGSNVEYSRGRYDQWPPKQSFFIFSGKKLFSCRANLQFLWTT